VTPRPTDLIRSARTALGRPRPSDVVAGLVTGLFSVPEGMAYASIGGFSPVQGIYAGVVPSILGSVFARTVLMITTLTSAIALTSGSVLRDAGMQPHNVHQVAALVLLTGVLMVAFGLLRLGVVMSFVSNAVMTGFATGIALQIVTGVLGDVSGYQPHGDNRIGQLVDWFGHIPRWQPASVVVCLATIAVWYGLRFIRPIRSAVMLLAMILVTAGATVSGVHVELVRDIARVPASLPPLVLPDFGAMPHLIGGAASVALVALAQAAGIGAAVPNPDRSRPNMNRDFLAQGVANLGGAFSTALPVGGSLSRTGVAQGAGARTRWAGIFAGAWLAVVVLTVGRLVELVPMAVIGALICIIGVELIVDRVPDIVLVVRTSWLSTAAMVVTFGATTQLPLHQAILIGAALSMLLYCIQSARQARLTGLERAGERWRVVAPPTTVEPFRVTVLDYTGSAFFAELPRIQESWPDMSSAHASALVLRIRGILDVPSSALVKVLAGYAATLHRHHSCLILAGVSPTYRSVLARSAVLHRIGPDNVIEEQPEIFGALDEAVRHAERWIAAHHDDPRAEDEP